MLVILLFVLLMFGSKKLPVARGMGRAVREFTAAREEIERELTHSGSSPAPEVKLPDVKR